MLITDVHSVSQLQVIEEASAKNNHRPKVRGLFQRADEANQNKRVYPKTILETQVKKLQPLISERRLCGELDHPQNDTVKLTNASHLVTKLWMEGAEVFGEAEILNTPAGKVAQALISDGVKIGISSRGLGTLSEDHMTGTKKVNEDFNLVTFDLVADPSTRGAYPALAENRILEEAKYERTMKEAVNERVFITMLKNKLSESTKVPKYNEGDRADDGNRKVTTGDTGKLLKRLQDRPKTKSYEHGETVEKSASRRATPNAAADETSMGDWSTDDGTGRGPTPEQRAKARKQAAKYHQDNPANKQNEEKSMFSNLTSFARRVFENEQRGYEGIEGGTEEAKKKAARILQAKREEEERDVLRNQNEYMQNRTNKKAIKKPKI